MKKGKQIQINFSNRWLYALITLGILAIISVGVYAIPGAVPNPGHSLSQLQACSSGETLITNSTGGWNCTIAGWLSSGNNIYYSTGNVGIGTINPATTLDVNGSIKVNGIYMGAASFTGICGEGSTGCLYAPSTSNGAAPSGLTGIWCTGAYGLYGHCNCTSGYTIINIGHTRSNATNLFTCLNFVAP